MAFESSQRPLLPLLSTLSTGFLMVGWFFCAGTGTLSTSWLGVSSKVWMAIAIGWHLLTLILSAGVAYLGDEGSVGMATLGRRILLPTFIVTLVLSAIFLVGLLKLEPAGPDYDVDSAPGDSTGFHIRNPQLNRSQAPSQS